MTIGENIRTKRKQKGMTLEELSHFVGVSRQTISRYENNIIAVPYDNIIKLASALNCSPAYLMGWEEEPDIPNHPDILPIETKKSPLSAQWRVVNRFMRKKILKPMSLLARKSKLMRP